MATVALQTPPRKWVVAEASPAAIEALVVHAHAARWPVPGVFGPVDTADLLAQRWQHHTGQRAHPGRRQRRYTLTRLPETPTAPGRARPGAAVDADTVTAFTRRFAAEVGDDADAAETITQALGALRAGHLFLWDDAGPVAMVRLAPATPTLWRVALVFTPAEHRRRGYAAALLAHRCAARLAAGARALTLSTDRANAPANALYQRLGFTPAGDTIDWFFPPP